MKLRTDQAFNGRRVRLGDTAIVCEACVGPIFDVVPHAATCIGLRGDVPLWQLHKVNDPQPFAVTGRFVETEAELVPGTWTW